MTAIRIVHELPDRLRVKMVAVKSSHIAQRIETKVQEVEGIHWVRANAKCAGLVVRFDRTVHSSSEIVDMLEHITMEGHA